MSGWFHDAGLAFAYSAEIDDKDAANISSYVGVVAVTRQTTRVQTGAAGYDFDLSVNANRAVLAAARNLTLPGFVEVFQGYFGLDTAPTIATTLLCVSSAATGTTADFAKFVEIGTDRKLRCYDKTGAQVGPTSTTLIPTTGLQEVTIVVNKLTLSTVYISVFFGGTEELAFDTGLTTANMFGQQYLFWGEPLGAANRGCHLYADDMTSRLTSTAADATHITAYPKFNIYGGVNLTSAGSYAAWDSMSGNTVDFANSLAAYIDTGELPTHDGDTSHLQTEVEGEKFSFLSTVANPLPDPCTVEWAAFPVVLRLTGAAKETPTILIKIGASEDSTIVVSDSGASTTFAGGQGVSGTEPDTTAWERADADASTLEVGCVAASADAGARVTLMVGPWWVVYEAVLPLSSVPQPAQAGDVQRRRGVVVG